MAIEYGERFKDEMDDNPFDLNCLDRLTRAVGDLGLICDLGRGAGQLAGYLHRQSVKKLGVELSAKVVTSISRLIYRLKGRAG